MLNTTAAIEAARKAKLDRLNAARAEDAKVIDQTPLHAAAFMKALGENLAKYSKRFSIFDEALTHSEELARYISCDTPGTYFQTRAGMLGTACRELSA